MSATIKLTAAAAAAASNITSEFVLGLLSNIQDNLAEYQAKVLEMETELRTLKIENNLLRNHVRELTSAKTSTTSTTSS